MNDVSRYLVLFDQHCSLCKNLAHLAAKRSGDKLEFMSWQEFYAGDTPANFPKEHLTEVASELRVWTGTDLHEGSKAWQFLLDTYPDLKGLSWVAQKLGLHKQTARAIQRVGHILRSGCSRCPPKLMKR